VEEGKPHPNSKVEEMNEREELDLFLPSGDVCVWRRHFVGRCEDKTHGVKSPYAENSDAIYDIHHPNQTELPLFWCSKDARHGLEKHRTHVQHQTCVLGGKSNRNESSHPQN
jgi:hypothetical protein